MNPAEIINQTLRQAVAQYEGLPIAPKKKEPNRLKSKLLGALGINKLGKS